MRLVSTESTGLLRHPTAPPCRRVPRTSLARGVQAQAPPALPSSARALADACQSTKPGQCQEINLVRALPRYTSDRQTDRQTGSAAAGVCQAAGESRARRLRPGGRAGGGGGGRSGGAEAPGSVSTYGGGASSAVAGCAGGCAGGCAVGMCQGVVLGGRAGAARGRGAEAPPRHAEGSRRRLRRRRGGPGCAVLARSSWRPPLRGKGRLLLRGGRG